jgi:MFS family permease
VATRPERRPPIRTLPRNVWAASAASFWTDVSTEMIGNLLPLFLANVLGAKTAVIGLVEGVATTAAGLCDVLAGRLSDRLQRRKGLAVAGYALSTLAKPVFAVAGSWPVVAGARWAERLGKGVRTAPRDALLADSTPPQHRGLAFGFHRAADTAGAVIGLLVAAGVVWRLQSGAVALGAATFRTVVLLSLIPAVLGLLCLAVGAREVPAEGSRRPRLALRGLGRPFATFLGIVAVFELGNSADAFLVLRAQERGLSVAGILATLVAFNAVYALVSTPAGRLSDRIGRRRLVATGWIAYAIAYAGFAAASAAWQVVGLYVVYGVYYGLSYGTAKALVADLVPVSLRGTAFGTYAAVVALLDLPASLLAGVLWQGAAGWPGFGPAAPFLCGALLAGVAAVALLVWRPPAGP